MTKNEETITTFIKSFDERIAVTFEESGCCYFNHMDRILNVDLNSFDSELIRYFREHVIEKHGFGVIKNINDITFAILHELGHYFCHHTYGGLDPLERFFIMLNPSVRGRQYEYFDREVEWEATEWAINFIKTNYAVVKLFEEKLLTNQ